MLLEAYRRIFFPYVMQIHNNSRNATFYFFFVSFMKCIGLCGAEVYIRNGVVFFFVKLTFCEMVDGLELENISCRSLISKHCRRFHLYEVYSYIYWKTIEEKKLLWNPKITYSINENRFNTWYLRILSRTPRWWSYHIGWHV